MGPNFRFAVIPSASAVLSASFGGRKECLAVARTTTLLFVSTWQVDQANQNESAALQRSGRSLNSTRPCFHQKGSSGAKRSESSRQEDSIMARRRICDPSRQLAIFGTYIHAIYEDLQERKGHVGMAGTCIFARLQSMLIMAATRVEGCAKRHTPILCAPFAICRGDWARGHLMACVLNAQDRNESQPMSKKKSAPAVAVAAAVAATAAATPLLRIRVTSVEPRCFVL